MSQGCGAVMCHLTPSAGAAAAGSWRSCDPPDLLDEQVDGFGEPIGAAIGGLEGQDLGLPGSHGASQPAAMELGPHPTALTADHGGRGLELELPLPARNLRGEDLEAVQPSQPSSRRTTVLTHLGLPSCRRHASASSARPQVPFWRLLRPPQQHTVPRFKTKSHHSSGCSPVRKPAVYLGPGCLATGSRPALFLAVPVSPVSKP
jgi:hypothetical protein